MVTEFTNVTDTAGWGRLGNFVTASLRDSVVQRAGERRRHKATVGAADHVRHSEMHIAYPK